MFASRESYLAHGKANLGETIRILESKLLKIESHDFSARIIFFVVMDRDGQIGQSCELTHFRLIDEKWKVFSTSRLSPSNFPKILDDLDWGDFEKEPEF